ncbi:MAG: ribbon-helix-helix protein, CopG family [Chloroflexota bacterium]|nr:MAG: ribbon-helix-helix protein, CopG family [Chloroflexota bacterium]
MRTTLTLDDDVAAALERLRKTRKIGLKALVNEALREGLQQMHARPRRRQRFHTQPVDLGRLRIGGLDNVGEALAIAEGEPSK